MKLTKVVRIIVVIFLGVISCHQGAMYAKPTGASRVAPRRSPQAPQVRASRPVVGARQVVPAILVSDEEEVGGSEALVVTLKEELKDAKDALKLSMKDASQKLMNGDMDYAEAVKSIKDQEAELLQIEQRLQKAKKRAEPTEGEEPESWESYFTSGTEGTKAYIQSFYAYADKEKEEAKRMIILLETQLEEINRAYRTTISDYSRKIKDYNDEIVAIRKKVQLTQADKNKMKDSSTKRDELVDKKRELTKLREAILAKLEDAIIEQKIITGEVLMRPATKKRVAQGIGIAAALGTAGMLGYLALGGKTPPPVELKKVEPTKPAEPKKGEPQTTPAPVLGKGKPETTEQQSTGVFSWIKNKVFGAPQTAEEVAREIAIKQQKFEDLKEKEAQQKIIDKQRQDDFVVKRAREKRETLEKAKEKTAKEEIEAKEAEEQAERIETARKNLADEKLAKNQQQQEARNKVDSLNTQAGELNNKLSDASNDLDKSKRDLEQYRAARQKELESKEPETDIYGQAQEQRIEDQKNSVQKAEETRSQVKSEYDAIRKERDDAQKALDDLLK